MITDQHGKDGAKTMSTASIQPVFPAFASEQSSAPRATYSAEALTFNPKFKDRYDDTIRKIQAVTLKRDLMLAKLPVLGRYYYSFFLKKLDQLYLDLRPYARVMWTDVVPNTVMTAGKNDNLDKYFAGSSYTATWFCGLISSVSYSAISAADTSASHAGWTEAGPTNAPNYSGGTRPALTFASASGGSKATSSASSYTFSGGGTIKGMFGITNSTKDGTTGILYNAVLFTGGDRVVASSDVVNVSVTYTLT